MDSSLFQPLHENVCSKRTNWRHHGRPKRLLTDGTAESEEVVFKINFIKCMISFTSTRVLFFRSSSFCNLSRIMLRHS